MNYTTEIRQAIDAMLEHQITKDECVERISGLFEQAETQPEKKGEWAVGKLVKITKCLTGHEFQIGEEVRLLKLVVEDGFRHWICVNLENDDWWITEDEAELID